MKPEPKIGKFIDDEEQELFEAIESAKAAFKSHLSAARQKEIIAIAKATMNDKRQKITLRISSSDLSRLKSKALQEGMPYQTLINSILHKAVS